jgi:hypothetical protein
MSDPNAPKNYDDLKALAAKLRRPLETLIALSSKNDPYLADRPARRAAAEWFAEQWVWFEMPPGAHVRRLHYRLVSQENLLTLPNGSGLYVNTLLCSQMLNRASGDARYLGLIPDGVIADHRNPEATIHLADTIDQPADVLLQEGTVWNRTDETRSEKTVLSLPSLTLQQPIITQRYHLEIWAEKSTMNDILLPIGRQYGINVVTAAGETSLTACELLVARVRASGRPCRIFFLSDHDPAGDKMPQSAARKIEYVIGGDTSVDIQLNPIAVTSEQCEQLSLPRSPIKGTETRAKKFEERFGEGGVELDALEALHPGLLAQMRETQIARYFDADLAANVRRVGNDAQMDIWRANKQVQARHQDEITALEIERDAISAEAEAAMLRRKEREAALMKRAEPLFETMAEELDAEAPDADDYLWPEPAEGDEDKNSLFDSTRTYLEQIECYRKGQGKQHEETTLHQRRKYTVICKTCGNGFITAKSRSICTKCRTAQWKNDRKAEPKAKEPKAKNRNAKP